MRNHGINPEDTSAWLDPKGKERSSIKKSYLTQMNADKNGLGAEVLKSSAGRDGTIVMIHSSVTIPLPPNQYGRARLCRPACNGEHRRNHVEPV